MVRSRHDGRAEAVAGRRLERERSRPELVPLPLHPDDVPPLKGLRLLLRPAVQRDADEEKDVGAHDGRGARGAERPEREPREDEGPVRVPLPREADGGDEVVRLAAPVVVDALRRPDAPEVEPEGAEVEPFREELRGAVDDLRVHRPAEQRVRVGDDGGPRRVSRRAEERLERARRAGEREGEHSDGGHVAEELSTRGGADRARPRCYDRPTVPMESHPHTRLERLEPGLAILVAALAVALVLARMAGDSPTSDEPVHIAAGVEILEQGTWTWNPEKPPLTKAGAALGLLGLDLRPPAGPFDPSRRVPNLVEFLSSNSAPLARIVSLSRLFSVATFLLLLWGVRHEARARFGPLAGGAAMTLAAFEPTLQAHAGLVHTDLALTCFFVLSLRPLGRLFGGDLSPRTTAWLGLFWGLGFLSKFSAPLLALMSLGLWFASPEKRPPVRAVAWRVLAAAGLALSLTLVGMTLAARNQSDADRIALAHEHCAVKGRSAGWERAVLRAGEVLPAAGNLLNGVASVVLQDRVGGPVNYLAGRVSTSGFPGYFPFALAVKTSLGLALAFLVGATAPRGRRVALAHLAGLAFFLVVSARSRFNIGVRHELFAFPVLAVVAGAALADGRRTRRLALGAAIAIQAVECASIAPHPLSFFNVLAGGPSAGRELLVDSNLDWGQDLARLAAAAPGISREPLPALVWSGDFPERHPSLRRLRAADVERPGQLLAMGETPLAIGPEFYAARGNEAEARAFAAVRSTLLARGRRVGSIGYSIGIWRIDGPP